MQEKTGEFFERRLDGYGEHMLFRTESAREFYEHTARCISLEVCVRILDFGCGTGLELEQYFARNPGALVTGIDLSGGC